MKGAVRVVGFEIPPIVENQLVFVDVDVPSPCDVQLGFCSSAVGTVVESVRVVSKTGDEESDAVELRGPFRANLFSEVSVHPRPTFTVPKGHRLRLVVGNARDLISTMSSHGIAVCHPFAGGEW